MKQSSSIVCLLVLLLGGGVLSCGSDQNILGKLVTGPQKKHDISYQLFQAEYYYDRGKFNKALTFAHAATAMDRDNEHAGLIEGAIEFGLAGLDIFSLAGKLIAQGEAAQSLALEGDESSDALSQLSTIFGITAEQVGAMTLDGNSVTTADGKVVKGAPDSGLFKDYPVLLPKKAAEARLAGGDTILHLSRAVMAICRFVEDDVKLIDADNADPRHISADCQKAPNTLRQKGKSYFLWALAHLVESLAFRGIVLYAPDGATPNLMKRSAAMSGTLTITQYLQGITELSAVLDVVFPIDPVASADSMLTAMVNDLMTVDRTFANMSGIPTSMTKSIKTTIKQIKRQKAKMVASQGGAATGTAGTDAQALKEQLTAKLSENLRTQITAKSAAGDFSPGQKTDACGAYQSISATPLDICGVP